MRIVRLVCLLIAVVGTSSSAQDDRASADSTPFTKQLKETVVFIKLHCREHGKLWDVTGTGFIVLLRDERLGKDRGFSYLITNRHVAICWDEARNSMSVSSISVRVNLKDGSSTILDLNTHGNMPWILPSNDSVDLALLPLGFDQSRVQYLSIPMEALTTDDVIKNRGVFEGERITFSGFFYQFQGVQRIQPIVREGIIAMLPDEDFPTTTGKPGRVYLGDVDIFGGNSGSPVFVNLGGLHGHVMSADDYRLLGVISGYFYEDEEFSLKVATTLKGKAQANRGIAIIVPAGELKALIEDPRVQTMRDAAITAMGPH